MHYNRPSVTYSIFTQPALHQITAISSIQVMVTPGIKHNKQTKQLSDDWAPIRPYLTKYCSLKGFKNRFDRIDKEFKGLMTEAKKEKNVIRATGVANLHIHLPDHDHNCNDVSDDNN